MTNPTAVAETVVEDAKPRCGNTPDEFHTIFDNDFKAKLDRQFGSDRLWTLFNSKASSRQYIWRPRAFSSAGSTLGCQITRYPNVRSTSYWQLRATKFRPPELRTGSYCGIGEVESYHIRADGFYVMPDFSVEYVQREHKKNEDAPGFLLEGGEYRAPPHPAM